MTEPNYKDIASREPSTLHEAFVKWIKRNTGKAIDPEAAALALRLHPHFRVSDEYNTTREKLRDSRQAETDAAHRRAQERLAARIADAEAKAAELKAKFDADALGTPAKPVRAKAKAKAASKPKATRPKAGTKPAVTPPATRAAGKDADEATVTSIKRPARARRSSQAPAADEDDDDPF
jgi:hypothetical protein